MLKRSKPDQYMNDIYAPTRKDEYEGSEEHAIRQLRAMGYNYLGQIELNKERRAFREVLLYDRLEAAIRRINPELRVELKEPTLTNQNPNL